MNPHFRNTIRQDCNQKLPVWLEQSICERDRLADASLANRMQLMGLDEVHAQVISRNDVKDYQIMHSESRFEWFGVAA